MSKPRIRLSWLRYVYPSKRWECVGDGYPAYGDSPVGAYLQWRHFHV